MEPANREELTGLRIASPHIAADSVTRKMADAGLLIQETATQLAIEVDGARQGTRTNFQADLPPVVSI